MVVIRKDEDASSWHTENSVLVNPIAGQCMISNIKMSCDSDFQRWVTCLKYQTNQCIFIIKGSAEIQKKMHPKLQAKSITRPQNECASNNPCKVYDRCIFLSDFTFENSAKWLGSPISCKKAKITYTMGRTDGNILWEILQCPTFLPCRHASWLLTRTLVAHLSERKKTQCYLSKVSNGCFMSTPKMKMKNSCIYHDDPWHLEKNRHDKETYAHEVGGFHTMPGMTTSWEQRQNSAISSQVIISHNFPNNKRIKPGGQSCRASHTARIPYVWEEHIAYLITTTLPRELIRLVDYLGKNNDKTSLVWPTSSNTPAGLAS